MDLASAFILGLFGSLHCAGMCGPLALALPRAERNRGLLAGRLFYNAGRLVTYALIGIIFGVVGQSLVLAGVQRWASIALGVVLLAGLFASRRLARLNPMLRVVQWLKTRMGMLLSKRSLTALGMLGMLNGLLPCGLVYVAAAGATVTGSALAGAGYMAAFGAGTVPMMLAISLSGSIVPVQLRLKLLNVVPFAVFALASLLILRGLSLGIPYISPDLSGTPGCCHPAE